MSFIYKGYRLASSVGFLQVLHILLVPFIAFIFIQNKYALIISQIHYVVKEISVFFYMFIIFIDFCTKMTDQLLKNCNFYNKFGRLRQKCDEFNFTSCKNRPTI